MKTEGKKKGGGTDNSASLGGGCWKSSHSGGREKFTFSKAPHPRTGTDKGRRGKRYFSAPIGEKRRL